MGKCQNPDCKTGEPARRHFCCIPCQQHANFLVREGKLEPTWRTPKSKPALETSPPLASSDVLVALQEQNRLLAAILARLEEAPRPQPVGLTPIHHAEIELPPPLEIEEVEFDIRAETNSPSVANFLQSAAAMVQTVSVTDRKQMH